MRCCEKRARLLERGGAVVVRRRPYTIRLKDRVGADLQPVRVKLDPGSKTTGIAVVTDADGNRPAKVLALFELARRGRQISEALRRAFRRRRRGANLRYQSPRFANRRKPEGWLPASLQRRVHTCMSWVERLRHPSGRYLSNAFGLIRRSKTRKYLVPSTGRVRGPGMRARNRLAGAPHWQSKPSGAARTARQS